MKKTEARIQQEIVTWFTNNYGLYNQEPKYLIFSVPNEGKNVKEQMYKKMIGMKSGVSDLIVIMKDRVIFVEVKDETGKQSDKQMQFENDVQDLGFEYYVVRSLEEFKQCLI